MNFVRIGSKISRCSNRPEFGSFYDFLRKYILTPLLKTRLRILAPFFNQLEHGGTNDPLPPILRNKILRFILMRVTSEAVENFIIKGYWLILTLPLRRKLRMRWFFDVFKVKESSFFFKFGLTDRPQFSFFIFWKIQI